ncbi:hypothetical protein BHE74_00057856, partial [Ensete ventricosum]
KGATLPRSFSLHGRKSTRDPRVATAREWRRRTGKDCARAIKPPGSGRSAYRQPGGPVCTARTGRFALPSGKALYRAVRTGPSADRYVDRSLLGGTAEIDHRLLISAVGDRLREKE